MTAAKKMAVFLHHPLEQPYAIERWASRRGFEITSYFTDKITCFPPLDSFDWLVVMGGTIGVYEQEEHPWIRPELDCIHSAIRAGKIVVGVCLGAQMIAGALGSKVYPHTEREFGFLPVTLSPAAAASPLSSWPQTATVMHWHGDTFDLPTGATLLASSACCPHQAFSYGDRVLALQFHPEFSCEDLSAAMEGWTPWPRTSHVLDIPEVLAEKQLPAEMNALLEKALDHLLDHA